MSEEFDAYYKWLGIPPKDQPPNHYRLLGIELFEENPEVIEASAERQATYLHEVSAGPNVKESQLLLNEIAAARLCLLDAEKKAAYDAKLESKVTAKVTVEALSSAPPLDDLPWDNPEDLMTGNPASATMAKGLGSSDTLPLTAPKSSGVFGGPQSLAAQKQDEAERQTQSSRIPVLWLAIGGGVALLVLIAVISIVVLSSGSDDSNVATNPNDPSTAGECRPDRPKGMKKKRGGKPNQRNLGTSETEREKDQDKLHATKNPNGADEPNRKDPDIDRQPKQQPATGTDTPVVQTVKQPDKPKDGDTAQKDGNGENPVVVKGPIRTNKFEPIQPTEVTSTFGTTFEVSEDCCVLADGRSRDDAYTFRATTPIPNITAIRLEAIPLKNMLGPGRGENGRFEITELKVHAAPFDGKTPESQFTLSGVVSDDDPSGPLDKLLDGDPDTFWPVQRPGQKTTLVMYMERPLGNDSGTMLRLELHQRHTLGHFRVSVSNDPALLGTRTPTNAKLPLFVNLGGKSEEGEGVQWLASQPFRDESFGHVGGESLESNSGSAPFSSCVSGIEAFRVRVPNGKYNVALIFCGRSPENVATRSFSVTVEGGKRQGISKIPGKAKGRQKAVTFGVQVEVSDGILNVDFAKEKGDTVLNGLVIQKAR